MLIAIKRTDGGVSIMQIVPQLSGKRGGDLLVPDIEGEIAKWKAAHRGTYEYADHIEISAADMPVDRTFRNAWISDGTRIAHDMVKCRAIHRDRLRQARSPLLAALDVAYQRAGEAGDDALKKHLVARKQELRDVTTDPRIDAAATPAELKAVWPDILAQTADAGKTGSV